SRSSKCDASRPRTSGTRRMAKPESADVGETFRAADAPGERPPAAAPVAAFDRPIGWIEGRPTRTRSMARDGRRQLRRVPGDQGAPRQGRRGRELGRIAELEK